MPRVGIKGKPSEKGKAHMPENDHKDPNHFKLAVPALAGTVGEDGRTIVAWGITQFSDVALPIYSEPAPVPPAV